MRIITFISALLFCLNVSAQKLSIQDINLSVTGDMVSLNIPDNNDDVIKVVEVNRIPDNSTSKKTGDHSKMKYISTGNGTDCKSVLTKGKYVFRVTTIFNKNISPNKEDLIAEHVFYVK